MILIMHEYNYEWMRVDDDHDLRCRSRLKSYLGGCTPYISEDRKYTISMRDKEKKRILTDYSINT